MTPDSYRLSRRGDRDVLERFFPPAVIARMSDNARGQFAAVLAKGGLKQAQETLRKTAGESDVRERIGVSRRSLSEIEELVTESVASWRDPPIRPFR